MSNPRPPFSSPLLCPVSEATVFCTVLEESPCSAADMRRKEMDFIFSPQNSEPKGALGCPVLKALCHCVDEKIEKRKDFIAVLAFRAQRFCIFAPCNNSFLSFLFSLPFPAQVLLHRDAQLSDIVSDHTGVRVRLRHVLCRFYRVSYSRATELLVIFSQLNTEDLCPS